MHAKERVSIIFVHHSEESKLQIELQFRRLKRESVPHEVILVNNAPHIPLTVSHRSNVHYVPRVVVPDFVPEGLRAGYEHGSSINAALKEVKTPYVLVMDYDFYPLGENWISKCLDLMKKENLAFFGAPYSPK